MQKRFTKTPNPYQPSKVLPQQKKTPEKTPNNSKSTLMASTANRGQQQN